MWRKLLYISFLIFLPLTLCAKTRQKVWVIDAGHGGNDHGCETARSMEKDINLRLAKRVAELVKANIPNVKVILTRDYDRYLTLDQRCVIANNANADLFLSIHVNSVPEVSTVSGTETFYGPQGGTEDKELERLRKKNIQKSELLAWMMQKYYGIAGRPISRGVKRERYYVLLYTKMPSILTEVGFITNPNDERYMTSKEGSEEIAQSIYRGLKDYDETVENDKIQSTLASLRRSGGQSNKNVIPAGKGPEKLVPEMDMAVNVNPTSNSTTQIQTSTQTSTQTQTPATAIAQSHTKTQTQTTTQTQTNTKTQATTPTTPVTPVQPEVAKNTMVILTNPTESKDSLLKGTDEPEELDEPLLFSVQIFSLRAKLQPTDPRFKGLKDLLVVEKDGMYKYLCGTTKDYAGARKLLAEVRETFEDAFLVAYKGNRQIGMSDAIEMLPK